MFATFPVTPTNPNRPNRNRDFTPPSSPRNRDYTIPPTPRNREYTPPPTPRNREYEYKQPPKVLKREHRVARIYEPKSPQTPEFPAKPESAHTHERPAPILELPGLPALELPHHVIDEPKERKKGFAGVLDSGKSWLKQINPPWVPKQKLKIPPTPTTPNTAKWANDEGYGYTNTPKGGAFRIDFSQAHADEEEAKKLKDPPPLYTKHEPEGGLKGWVTVAAAFLIQFCTIGYLFTWNVFEDHYTHHFLTDQNPIAIRFIGSVQWFLAFFLALVGGKLADMGFFRYVVGAGSAIFATSLILLSFAPEEMFGLVFVTQALGMGTGIGLVFVPTATVVTHYFKRQRGFAIGIAMSGGSLGGMIWPGLLRAFMPKHGLATSVRITAGIIIFFLLVANGAFFKFTPPNPTKEDKRSNAAAFPVPRLDLAKYTKEMEYIFIAGATFLAMLFIYYPVWYLELIGLERGVNPNVAFASVIILSFTGILGRVGLGFASDKVGAWNLLFPVSGLMALMMLTMCTVQNTANLVGFSMFYGIFSAAWLSLLVTALTSLAARPSEIGTRVGLILSLSSFAQLFSALLQDLMLMPNFSWGIPSAISALVFVAITALAFLSRKMLGPKTSYRKRRYLPKVYKYKFQIQ